MKTQILRMLVAIGFFTTLVVAAGSTDGFSTFTYGHSPARASQEIVLKLILRARKETHTFGDEIRFQQKMENESDVRVTVENFDLHLQNRPRLLLNGEAVPYKTKTAELIHSKKTDLGRPMSVALGFIEPHSLRDLEELDLSDWYDTLQPGSYQLTNKYRPFSAGGWIKESAEIKFSIEPKN